MKHDELFGCSSGSCLLWLVISVG